MAKRENIPWFMNPKSPVYKRFMRSQMNPMGPYMQAARRVLGQMTPDKDPYVQALRTAAGRDVSQDPALKGLEALMGGVASREDISKEYGGAQERLMQAIQGMDFGAGGRAVGDIASALGAAIGADLGQTKDIAQTAGTVSGMGGQGGDVYSKAIGGSLGAQMEQLKAQRQGEAEGRRAELGMSRAQLLSQLAGEGRQMGLEAARAASDIGGRRQQLMLEMGQSKAQGRQMLDPFRIPMAQQALIQSMLQTQGLRQDLKQGGYSGGLSWSGLNNNAQPINWQNLMAGGQTF